MLNCGTLGADLLASQGFRVYLPDILHGDYAQPAWYSGADLEWVTLFHPCLRPCQRHELNFLF